MEGVTPQRAALVSDFLAGCHAVYADHPGDIDGWQVVNDYTNGVNQRKYIHMYFAKSVGCWRYLRAHTSPLQDGHVVSIGAGPCLCLLGWFFDTPPSPTFRVLGADVLSWEEIHGDASFNALRADVLGNVNFTYHSGRFFPPTQPPQTDGLHGLEPIGPEHIPEGATVLLPFVMNHILGTRPHPEPQDVGAWLEAVRARASRVVLVDMQYVPEGARGSTHGFWTTLLGILGFGPPTRPAGCPVFAFNAPSAEFADCYDADNGQRRSGIRYPHFCTATGLVGDAQGWRYIG